MIPQFTGSADQALMYGKLALPPVKLTRNGGQISGVSIPS